MDEELDVVVIGFDVERRQAEAGLMHVFGIEPHSARRLVRELPMVAKRQASRSIAEHYVAALRSIGARVEIRRADLNALNQTSLPAPLPSALAGLRESVRVNREADHAIARFRAAEGLDSVEHSEDGVDLFNPAIPKAPLVPHDLARMPNAALPVFTDPPGRSSSPSLDSGLTPASRTSDARSANTQLQPVSSADALLDPEAFPASADAQSVRPGAIGVVRGNSSAPGRPSAASHSSVPSDARARPLARTHRRWVIVTLFAVLVFAGLRAWTAFATHRRLESWQREGIDPGDYADASAWLGATDHSLPGMSKDAGLALLGRMRQAGARDIYVIRVRMIAGGHLAGGLLVELPDDAAARHTLLEQTARLLPGATAETDHGQRFAVASFP
jgi:hypothetical protein